MELRSRRKTKWQGMGFRSGQRWKVPGPQARRSKRTHQQGRETLAPVRVIPLAIASRTDLFSFRAIYRFEGNRYLCLGSVADAGWRSTDDVGEISPYRTGRASEKL